MVPVKEDLTGKIFGRLKVIRQGEDYTSPQGKRYAQWICNCSCGSTNILIMQNALKRGHTQSCGCLQRETAGGVKKYNKWDENIFEDEFGEYRIGYTTNTNKEFYIDAEDYDKVKNYAWLEHLDKKRGYNALEARDIETKKIVKIHQIIFGKSCDHKDRNPLNNRKYNLRIASFSQNNMNQKKQINNTSGFIGVSWHKGIKKWTAQVTVNTKTIYLGSFIDKNDAIIARLRAEKIYYGEFAPQRNLFVEYGV